MMWLLILQVLMLCCITTITPVQEFRYVKPDNSLNITCPGQPCFTLDQYTGMADKYFTTRSTFIFLSGNHSLHTVLSLTNVSDVFLQGIENSSVGSSILLEKNASIVCYNSSKFHVEGLVFILCKYRCKKESALRFVNVGHSVIYNSVFIGTGNEVPATRSVESQHSNTSVLNCLFERNTGYIGGAIEVTEGSILYISGSTFTRNRAEHSGGAISAYFSIIVLDGNMFLHNIVESGRNGGALACGGCTLIMTGNNTFDNNHVTVGDQEGTAGGAVSMVHGKLAFMSGNAFFSRNLAEEGGAIAIHGSQILCTESATVILSENKAVSGGGMYIIASSIQTSLCNLTLINNSATSLGGGIVIQHSTGEIIANFVNNTAEFAGAAFIQGERNITFKHTNITRNSANAVSIQEGRVTFIAVRIYNNSGNVGGGIYSWYSNLLFRGYNTLHDNTALRGGAMYTVHGKVTFEGVAIFSNNSAEKDGGALYSVGTIVDLQQMVNFTFNQAQNGGAVYFRGNAYMTVDVNTNFNSSFNTAVGYGGGVYNTDRTSPVQCSYDENILYVENLHCIFQVHATSKHTSISSYYDSAGTDGNFLYGGLLDRCQLKRGQMKEQTMFQFLVNKKILTYVAENNRSHTSGITSKPYALCFCDGPNQSPDCTSSRSIVIHRGQAITVPLVAIAQGNSVTSTSVTAITNPTASLKLGQNPQHLPPYCSNLTYNLFSTEKNEDLILYPEGPCHGSGFAKVIFNLTVLPCPDGFILVPDGQCECEKRLRKYDMSCIIDEDIYLMKKAGSEFWLGAAYTHTNGAYKGVVLYKTCPIEYCRTDEVNLTLHDLDTQCAHGRIGVLCGSCAENYSLLIGSSKCKECSNTYLLLILPFAAAGIALVALLSILRLTVATGMINSLIFYANIVQVNRKLFFPANTVNVLTIFIAWLNLDLGFETCFYDGMDAFAQTCLQFAFPVYVWVLISVIILTSRYSITVSKLIGHNPIAVLATLLLMSYTKVLKIVIEVYSSVKLDYPHNMTVTVWLKDANVPYLQSNHLVLTVVTSLILVFLFFPYTLLLLLGHKLYRLSGRKYFRWLNRMKPLLDSYYAPYKTRTRYWTGFLLLVRCALYIVFSFNSLGGTRKSLLAIIITFTAIGFVVGFCRIYKKLGVNILEASAYLNLVTLSAVTALANHRTVYVLQYILTGLMVTSTGGVVAYHFHILYTAKSAMWLKIKIMIARHFQSAAEDVSPATNYTAGISSHDPYKIVTSKSVISLREPLLESESDGYNIVP